MNVKSTEEINASLQKAAKLCCICRKTCIILKTDNLKLEKVCLKKGNRCRIDEREYGHQVQVIIVQEMLRFLPQGQEWWWIMQESVQTLVRIGQWNGQKQHVWAMQFSVTGKWCFSRLFNENNQAGAGTSKLAILPSKVYVKLQQREQFLVEKNPEIMQVTDNLHK